MLVAGVVDEEEPIQVRTFYLPALDVESLNNDKPIYDPGMTEPYQVRTCSVRQKDYKLSRSVQNVLVYFRGSQTGLRAKSGP